jgi:arginine decarboxylase
MTDLDLLPDTHTAACAPASLRIRLARGVGAGPTELAAFDAALMDAGVANYNLICLSSVIPPHSSIERGKHRTPPSEYGRRLYVVLSQMRQRAPGAWAHAGIGWVQNAARRHGLFVELHDDDRQKLQADLQATLESMQRSRAEDYGPIRTEIASARCIDRPVCALVIAVYRSTPW